MPILRINNYLDDYRLRAQREDIHELAGRPDKKAATEFVNRRIVEAIAPGPEDVVVDIGCGDASLLKRVAERGSRCIGIAATTEEKARLHAEFPSLLFVASKASQLDLDSGIASWVVCNTTLIFLPRNEVDAALREMVRIARPGARIWLGEVPEVDEYAEYRMYRGTSMPAFVCYQFIHHGLRSGLGMCRRWVRALIGSEQIILNSAGFFYATPERLISTAQSCGLRLETYFRHKDLDTQGNIVNSKFRYDYIFTV